MSTAERWEVELSTTELEKETRAAASLVMDNGTCWQGHGIARRHRDAAVTEIGEKIAVARALSDLAHTLLSSAAAELEDLTHKRAATRL